MISAGPSEQVRAPRAKAGRTHRSKDSAITRAEISRAAARLFAQRGYAHVTLQDIADDAGVTPALINRYFVSKRSLFELVARSRVGMETPLATNDINVLAQRIVTYWLNKDATTSALALVRSIDLDGGSLLREELHRRIVEPWSRRLGDSDEARVKVRLVESLLMGVGLFGIDNLLGDRHGELTPEAAAAMASRIARMLKACLGD